MQECKKCHVLAYHWRKLKQDVFPAHSLGTLEFPCLDGFCRVPYLSFSVGAAGMLYCSVIDCMVQLQYTNFCLVITETSHILLSFTHFRAFSYWQALAQNKTIKSFQRIQWLFVFYLLVHVCHLSRHSVYNLRTCRAPAQPSVGLLWH